MVALSPIDAPGGGARSQGLTGRERRNTLTALLPFFGLTVVLGLLSDGVHHDDDLSHYLMARWSGWFPAWLLHVWGRPGLTIPLAAVAWIGDHETAWRVCRLLSAMTTAGGAWMAACLSVRLGVRRPWLVVVACYLQPLATTLACTTLTENFAALYLVAAILLLEKRRGLVASLVFSLVLVTRHEAVVLLPVWWVALAARGDGFRRSLTASAAAVWAPLLHNVAFFAVCGKWPASLLFAASGSTDYLPVGVLSYLPHAFRAIPPVLLGLAVIGGAALIRRGRWLPPAVAGVFVLTHCAVMTLGVYASGGFARFMVVISPLAAVLGVAGWNRLHERNRANQSTGRIWLTLAIVWLLGLAALELERLAGRAAVYEAGLRLSILIATSIVVPMSLVLAATARKTNLAPHRRLAAAVLGLTVLGQWASVIRPLDMRPDQAQAADVVQWLRDNRLDRRPIFAADPWITHWLDLVEDPTIHKGPRRVAAMPIGTIVVWESLYSDNDFHRLDLEDLRGDEHYVLIESFEPGGNRRRTFHLFEKISDTEIPPGPDEMYPPNLMAVSSRVTRPHYIRVPGA